jgi:hypothetical protein
MSMRKDSWAAPPLARIRTFSAADSQRNSHGSLDRPRNPASWPGQTDRSVLKMCIGRRTAEGSPPRSARNRLSTVANAQHGFT